MNTSDPLKDPDIALRLILKERRQAAICFVIIGAYFLYFVLSPLDHRTPIIERVNDLSKIIGVTSGSLGVLTIALGIRFLVRESPLIKLVLDLNERVRKLEAKS